MMSVFEKGERLRHIGHLDIQRAMQRALRRSGMPVKYSQGFNPHILVTFASALSTGAYGRRELMDVTLREQVEPDVFLTAMNGALPPDMQLSFCRVLEDQHPALMSLVAAADCTMTLTDEDAAKKCADALGGFLRQESIMEMRKTKSGMKECDIRPLIHSLSVCGNQIHAVLTLHETTSCKPDMLVRALCRYAGCEVPRFLTCRNGLLGENAHGELTALEML